MSISPRSVVSSTNQNAPFSVTSLLSPLDAALSSPVYSSSIGDPSSRGISSGPGVVGVGGGGLAPCASVTDFASAAVAMQNPYGMSPMAHMAQFGSAAASTYQYCNTDLSHYATNPASAAAWYGSSTTDPRFASKYNVEFKLLIFVTINSRTIGTQLILQFAS